MATTIASKLKVPQETAQKFIDNYFEKFYGLKIWLDNIGEQAKYQKWVQCPISGRIYWVAEANAKGEETENSAIRKATNALIQGISSIMTKEAGWYTDIAFEKLNFELSRHIPPGKEARLVAIVHDELVSYVPGTRRLVDMVFDKELDMYVPKYKYSEISYKFAKEKEKAMCKAMDNLFHTVVPGFPSKADAAIAEAWSAK